MNNLKLFLLLTCFFSGSVFSLLAQEDVELKPLSTILTTLEEKFDVRFNYLETTIEGIRLVPPDAQFDLSQSLDYLNKETELTYTNLGNTFISVTANSQTFLCGYIVDKDTQEPLVSATVLANSASSVTDNSGYFELVLSGTSEMITIRYLGYKTVNRSSEYFRREGCHPIYMVAEASNLETVILTNFIVNGIDKLNDGSFELDVSRFSILPGLIEPDVLQTVQAFPGIQSVNETVSNLNIRGGTHDQNLILWDDIKMYQSGHFFGLISVFNPQITQKVSLLKNGTPSAFSDGVSGTIAMKTDEQVNSRFKGNVGINLIDADGFVDVPLGKRSSLQVAARKSISDFFKTPTYEEYFDRISQDTEVTANESSTVTNSDENFDFYDTSLRWLFQLSDKDRIRLNFITIFNELIFNENAVIDLQETSRESSVSQNSIAAGLLYERKWNESWETLLQLYNTDYKLKAENANILQNQRFLQENKVSETGARITAQYLLNDTMKFQLGGHFTETQVTNLDDVDFPRFRLLVSEVVRTYSGFTQWSYLSSNNNTSLNLGVRYNYLEKFSKSIVEPRLTFSQQFLEHFSFELAGEFKHQITSQVINFQNDFLGVEKRRWQLSNDDTIPVIQSKQGSAGFNFSNDGWLLSLDAYYKEVEGITTQSQGFQNQYEFVKTDGSYEVIGLDVMFRKQIRNATFWSSYSFMDNEYTFDSLPEVSFPSNLDITHAVTLGSTYRLKSFSLSAGLNWRTGKPTTFPRSIQEITDGEISYEDSNSSRLEDYLRVDVSALYDLQLDSVKLQAGVSVWNMLDETNQLGNYFRLNSANMPQEFIQNSLGLTTNAVIRCFF